MIKLFLLASILILSYPSQDVHVATWSTGTPDSDSYESLSFWVKENHRAYIRYTHGKDAEAVNLSWIGSDSLPGQRGFRISPPQSDIGDLHVIPQGNDLHVFDGSNHYDKSFHWENENDTTASCSICAQNDRQAMGWLRRYFF